LTTEGDWALNLASGSVLSLAFGSYLEGDTSALTTLDREQQLATRVALEPAATPTAAQPAPAAAGSSRSLWALLALASFVLLLSVAVLTFLFMTRRNAQS
jgi:hypothetical protein